MNGAGAWPGYMVNQDYVEGGKNYENDTPGEMTGDPHPAARQEILRCTFHRL